MSVVEKNQVKLLVVDDEDDFRDTACMYFRKQGYPVDCAKDGREALRSINQNSYDVAIVDIHMPEMNGIELLKEVQDSENQLHIIMLTGGGTIENAVESMKIGAYDYLTKPARLNELDLLVQQAYKHRQLEQENRQLRHALKRVTGPGSMIGHSDAMKEVFRLIDKTAVTNKPVLIQGESGTGKELVARAIHEKSSLADKPMVVINCAALPEALLESELFGHEKGAFTGAAAAKPGLFEIADGGTLFIDEFGDLAGSLQAKLLRVLEDGSLRRIGSVKERKVKVRIIAATNRNLSEEVEKGRFREDLFYRINVLGIHLPPLRQRAGDVEQLIRHFVGEEWKISDDVVKLLAGYSWPGNVRQLQNAIERARILADDDQIIVENLPEEIVLSCRQSPEIQDANPHDLETINRNHVVQVYEKHGKNKTRTAKALGIGRRSLYRLLEKYQID